MVSEAEQVLGKLVASEFASQLASVGWNDMVKTVRGRSDISETVGRLPHRAARLLDHLRKRRASVPVAIPPWSRQRCDSAMERGSHQSSHGEREFVAEEMLDFCRQGY